MKKGLAKVAKKKVVWIAVAAAAMLAILGVTLWLTWPEKQQRQQGVQGVTSGGRPLKISPRPQATSMVSTNTSFNTKVDPSGSRAAPVKFVRVGELVPLTTMVASPHPTHGVQDASPLPLYGYELYGHRFRWMYHTVLPDGSKASVIGNSRDCMDDDGCDELKTNEHVTVPEVPGLTCRVVIGK